VTALERHRSYFDARRATSKDLKIKEKGKATTPARAGSLVLRNYSIDDLCDFAACGFHEINVIVRVDLTVLGDAWFRSICSLAALDLDKLADQD
jgi:hypothetical protein